MPPPSGETREGEVCVSVGGDAKEIVAMDVAKESIAKWRVR